MKMKILITLLLISNICFAQKEAIAVFKDSGFSVKYKYMMTDNFERLLGSKISNANAILDCVFEDIFPDKKYYATRIKEERSLYGINYNVITLTTDDKKNIESITIDLKDVVNDDFYNLFIADYGKPNSILIVEKEIVLSETEETNSSFNQKMRKVELKLREGQFNEGPLLMIWKKKDYEIKILIRHDRNTSDITFSKHKKA